jgi:hypothetical protein
MRTKRSLLFLVTLVGPGCTEASRAEDFATPGALDMDWFRAFRSTFNNTAARRFAATGTRHSACFGQG